MKSYPEIVAEGIKRTVYSENRKPISEQDEYDVEITYLPGGTACILIQLEVGSEGVYDDDCVPIKSASDAAKAYQNFYNKNCGDNSGIYATLGFGSDLNASKDVASVVKDEYGISYGGDMNDPVFGLLCDNTSANDMKKKSDAFFKQFDVLIKMLAEIEKAAKSKNLKNIEKVFSNVEKTEKKIRGAASDYIEVMENGDKESVDLTSKEQGKDIDTRLCSVEYM